MDASASLFFSDENRKKGSGESSKGLRFKPKKSLYIKFYRSRVRALLGARFINVRALLGARSIRVRALLGARLIKRPGRPNSLRELLSPSGPITRRPVGLRSRELPVFRAWPRTAALVPKTQNPHPPRAPSGLPGIPPRIPA